MMKDQRRTTHWDGQWWNSGPRHSEGSYPHRHAAATEGWHTREESYFCFSPSWCHQELIGTAMNHIPRTQAIASSALQRVWTLKASRPWPIGSSTVVEVVLRYFHWHYYKSSLLWFFIGDGLDLSESSYGGTWWTRGFTWFGQPERNTLCPWERGVVLLSCSSLDMNVSKRVFSGTEFVCRLFGPFIAQCRTVTLWSRAWQVTSGWLDLYAVGIY
jgi:hypothetical protein